MDTHNQHYAEKSFKVFKLNKILTFILSTSVLLSSQLAYAQSNNQTKVDAEKAQEDGSSIEVLEVEGRSRNLIGEAISASEGVVGQSEIASRPMLRTGEVLELVPGMVVTQHSGSGKANQYFLRGFNLDHGTDFASIIDGMPINMRSHGHGQVYTDLSFIIPETIQTLKYKKGAYYAEVGDFSGAGSAEFITVKGDQSSQVSLSLGDDGYQRYLAMSSTKASEGSLNVAVEVNYYDGPWTDIKEDVNKTNIFAKYDQRAWGGNLSVSLMAYENKWNSADQIPLRAVTQGIIDEFGSLDTNLGGKSNRYSLNAHWQNDQVSASLYAIDYGLNLWSNFTYFLDNPDTGDQFEQVDDRKIFGGHLDYLHLSQFNGKDMSNKVGLQVRYDDIAEVGLFRSQAQRRIGPTRLDSIEQSSVGLFWENKIAWSDNLRTTFGARYDSFDFDVESLVGVNVNGVDLSGNQGSESDGNLALKGSVIYTFNESFEGYFAAGQGFHSNDARGTISQIDPNSGEVISPVDPLVDSFGYELGLRMNIDDRLNASASIWTLDLDSELLFVGDAGNTEASFESTRSGLEITAYYRYTDDLIFDLEYAITDSEFKGVPSNENAIPGAIDSVIQAGVSWQPESGWFGAARIRYLGERPLVEDESVTADSVQVVNVNLGYRYSEALTVQLDILNALDSNDHDIDYFYASRLASEPAGAEVEDLHYHVLVPRSLRLSVAYAF
jgi:outer membrane cobalamin receptor